MNYIITHPNGIEVHHNIRQTEVLNITIKQYINRLLVKELTNYEGRIDALKRTMNQKRNIPIYINERCLIYHSHHIRELRNYCINYLNILSIKKHSETQTLLIFKDLTKLRLNCSYQKVTLKHKQCQIMLIKLKETGVVENVF